LPPGNVAHLAQRLIALMDELVRLPSA
jgi:hypothetical protein